MNELPIDHDTRWKVLIMILFKDFIAFFLPDIYLLIDWTKPVESLDQELYELVADKYKGGLVINDKLFKVHLKDGGEHLLLIHVEVQSSNEVGFQERMFVYFYRIFDTYGKIVTALAVFTSNSLPSNYNRYDYQLLGTKATYEYNTYCVKHATEEELLASDNPFALAVLAAKYVNLSKKKNELRYTYKRKLFRLAIERNYPHDKIRAILQFIQFLLILPTEMEEKFITEMKNTHQIEQPKFNEFEKQRANMWLDAMYETVYGKTVEEERGELYLANKKAEEATKEAEEATKEAEEATKEAEEATKEAEEATKATKEATKKAATKMLQMTDLTVQQIAEILGQNKQEILDIQAALNQK